jgi:hypothetical protein
MLAAVAAYVFVFQRNANEQELRTLRFQEGTVPGDRIRVSVTVTGVNPTARELTAQLAFAVAGKIARDEITPSADLKLLVNSIGGQQEFDFPKGTRLHRIDATFPLVGELNRYPLDRYNASLQFLVTTPQRLTRQQVTQPVEGTPRKNPNPEDLAVGSETKEHVLAVGAESKDHVQVPISITVLASVPGIKFTGDVSRSGDPVVTGLNLNLKRPRNLIVVSILVMCGMITLALSVFAMALKASASATKVDYLPLSLAISLIFGLPALRNIQPYVPPVGALVDYLSFIWAELFVATAAIITIWSWLARSASD